MSINERAAKAYPIVSAHLDSAQTLQDTVHPLSPPTISSAASQFCIRASGYNPVTY
jgi:hypothetical protein